MRAALSNLKLTAVTQKVREEESCAKATSHLDIFSAHKTSLKMGMKLRTRKKKRRGSRWQCHLTSQSQTNCIRKSSRKGQSSNWPFWPYETSYLTHRHTEESQVTLCGGRSVSKRLIQSHTSIRLTHLHHHHRISLTNITAIIVHRRFEPAAAFAY